MTDRQPYPGKEGLMKHTPCDASGVPTGAPAYYAKVDMADSPLEIGTPFNKANLLSDTTAAKLDGVETPNAAFDLLSRFHAGMGNEYVWQRSDGVYVNSTVSNAYPPTPSDGYTYTALGQIGSKVRIATGSYTGTGTHESWNPNSLIFGFVPKFIAINGKGQQGTSGTVIFVNGATEAYEYYCFNITGISGWGTNTVSWYSTADANDQANASGQIYQFVAIG